MYGLVHKGSMYNVSRTKVFCAETSGIDVGGWGVGFVPAEGRGEGVSPLFELEVKFAGELEVKFTGEVEGAIRFGDAAAGL